MKARKWKHFLATILTAVMCLGEVGGTGMKVFAQDDAPVMEETEETVVAVEDGATYNLWVGGVQVTDANKDDIPGVTSGKASYDPATNTLTLNGVKGFKGQYENLGTKAYVFGENLSAGDKVFWLKGDASFAIASKDDNGILFRGSQVGFDADLSISGSGYPVSVQNLPLTIAGGNYDLKSTSWTALNAAGLFVKGGTLKAEGKKRGIGSNEEIDFSGGDVTATGVEYGIWSYDAVYVTAGTVRATATGKPESSATHAAVDNGTYSGLYADGRLMMTGGHVIATGDMHGVYTTGDIEINRGAKDAGYLEATATGATTHEKTVERVGTFAKEADITVAGGWLKSSGKGGAIASYNGSINMTGKVTIREPEGGSTWTYDKDQNRYPQKTTTVITKSAVNPAESVLIGEEEEGYSLYLGRVEVNNLNKDNIPIASGKASFDPDTRTLSCENAVINTFYGVDNSQAIWTDENLTITGKLTINKVDDSGYGIILVGNHTLSFNDAEVTAKGMKYSAVFVPSGTITINNSRLDVSATSDDANVAAIYAGRAINLNKAWITASSRKEAIRAKEGIKQQSEHVIVNPAGADFDEKKQTIVYNSAAVKDLEIQQDIDEVWVGSTRVKNEYLNDVLGDGKVSFDPETKTLHFAPGAVISDVHSYKSGQDTCIYSQSDLRIEGSVKLNNKNGKDGIFCKGALTLNADIEGEVGLNLAYASEMIRVEGGKIKGKSACGLQSPGKIEIKGGEITLETSSSSLYGIYETELLISGGEISLLSDSQPVIYVKNFGMTGGHLYGKNLKGASVFRSKSASIDNNMYIAIPEGGYTDGAKILQKNGTSATEMEIYEKGTKDCKVSFDMGGHGTNPGTKTVKDHTAVEKPANPSAEGWNFMGWYADDTFRDKFDFTQPILRDTTVYALWYEKGDYELWLGDTPVNDTNCTDILGDGKASYDPTTNTLMLKNYTGNGKYSEDSDGNKILIYAKQDLTIKGSATLTSDTANIGIASKEGSLTIDADLTVNLTTVNDGKADCAIWAMGGDITVNGGSIRLTVNPTNEEIQSYGMAVGSGKITINDGMTLINAGLAGMIALSFVEGADLIMNGGELQANGLNSTGIGIYLLTGKLQMNAGTLKATGRGDSGAAVAFAESVVDSDYVEIVKPVGGKWDDKGQTVLNADGTTAMEVEIARRQFTVTFDLNGKTVYEDTAPKPQKVYAGKPAMMPENPVADGFAFKGWYTDQACTEEFSFIGSSITKDTTLYAKWAEGFTVSFDVGDAPTYPPVDQSVEEGDKVTDPGLIAPEGWIFKGWYKNLTDETPYDFNTPVTGSFTLHAKWEKEKRTVTFDANGHGTAPAAITVDYGDAVSEPTAPTAEGFRFMGWYLDSDGETPYDFKTPVTKNFTLYANWADADAKIWTVTFDVRGHGTKPADQQVEDGKFAADPGALTAAGFLFEGWYAEAACENRFAFSSTPIVANTTIYAKWTPNGIIPIPLDEGTETWNLFEDNTTHTFTVEGVSASKATENTNAKSKNFYNAVLNGSNITVSLKDGAVRKKAALAANTLLEFDLGEDGVAAFNLPVSYVKPVFKLSSKNATIKPGETASTVKTALLYKAPGGQFEPYDLTGATVTFGDAAVTAGSDGVIEITTKDKIQGKKITITKDGWDTATPVALAYTVKASAKSVVYVNLKDLKTVIVNKNAPDQVFLFDVTLNGSLATAETVTITDKKDTKMASINSSGQLEIKYASGVKAGVYTITLNGDGAKTNVKVKVSEKALNQAITAKVQSKFDVVTKQPMVIVPQMKDLGGHVTAASVASSSPTGFTVKEVNDAGNILLDYTGSDLSATNLKVSDLKLSLTVDGVTSPVEVAVKNANAKKTAPIVKVPALTIPKNAEASGDKVIGSANILGTYRVTSGRIHTIEPEKVEIAGSTNVTVEQTKTGVQIKNLTGKNGTVKLALTFPGGAKKNVTVRVKRAK